MNDQAHAQDGIGQTARKARRPRKGQINDGNVTARGKWVEMRAASPYWQIVFCLFGKRVSKSSGTRNKREAEKAAASLHDQMTDDHVRVHGSRGVPMRERDGRLIDVAAWFEANFAKFDADAADTRLRLLNIVQILSPDIMLSQITDGQVVTLIAKLEERDRRGDPDKGKLSDERVDAHVKTLRRLMNETVRTRKFYLPDMPDWPRHTLPDLPRTREASIPEMDAIVGAWRADTRAALLFVFESGLRRTNACELTWQQVDWANRVIHVKVKAPRQSRRRKRRDIDLRRKSREIPITPVIAEILAAQWGKHETAVFTLTAGRTQRSVPDGVLHERGQHYPLKSGTFASQWQQVCRTCGVVGLRIHDLRRTRGSWLYRATGDIKLVKAFLHHANIQTTDTTYAHVLSDQVAEGMIKAGAYEAAMRKRLADLGTILPGTPPGGAAVVPVRALPAPAVGFAETATELDPSEGVSNCQEGTISSTSSTPCCRAKSIDDARDMMKQLELNPRFAKLISDHSPPNDSSQVDSDFRRKAGKRTLQKQNYRTNAEANSMSANGSELAPQARLSSRFAQSCDPYMDDPGFVISFVEALDRCFSAPDPVTGPTA